jgi:beta-lactam-binding protein with PASTA domain
MKKIRALRNNILFTFDQDIVQVDDGKSASTAFGEILDWGFAFSSFKESTEQARWGTVFETGPDVDPIIKRGMHILIDKLKWTNGVKFDNMILWRTDDDCVLGYE